MPLVTTAPLQFRIRQEGEHVLCQFTHDGKSFVLQLEGKVSVDIGKLMQQKGLLADEWAQRERVADDSAILLRAGSNFALSNDPRIIEESKIRAAWGRIRRYMPGGVKSEEAFGTPRVVKHAPKGV